MSIPITLSLDGTLGRVLGIVHHEIGLDDRALSMTTLKGAITELHEWRRIRLEEGGTDWWRLADQWWTLLKPPFKEE